MYLNKCYFPIFLFFLPVISEAGTIDIPKDSITVFIFLREDCKICEYYTKDLNQFYEKYKNEQLHFTGIFPNFSSKPKKIETFKKKYNIAFPLKHDYFKTLTKKMGATVTPEIVIYNHTLGKIIYQGRIDNTYFSLGKKRTVTTTAELAQVLDAISTGKPIPDFDAPAVGCFINFSDM